MTDEERDHRPQELIDKMNRDEHVSRWDVFHYRKAIRAIIRDNPSTYGHLEYEFEDLVDSAKESL